MSNLNIEDTVSRKRGRLARTLLVAAAGLLLSAGTALAQDAQAPAPDQNSGMSGGRHHHHGMASADDQLKHLTKKLNLSDDQQAKLKPILEEHHNQLEQLRADNSTSREDRWKKMREIRENSDNQIKSVLNEDQQKQFDQMREEQRSRMKEHMGAHAGGEAPPAQ